MNQQYFIKRNFILALLLVYNLLKVALDIGMVMITICEPCSHVAFIRGASMSWTPLFWGPFQAGSHLLLTASLWSRYYLCLVLSRQGTWVSGSWPWTCPWSMPESEFSLSTFHHSLHRLRAVPCLPLTHPPLPAGEDALSQSPRPSHGFWRCNICSHLIFSAKFQGKWSTVFVFQYIALSFLIFYTKITSPVFTAACVVWLFCDPYTVLTPIRPCQPQLLSATQ